MSTNDTDDENGTETKTAPARARWPDEEVLRDYLESDEDLTYGEIADRINEAEEDREWAVTEAAIIRAGRSYGLIGMSDREPKWTRDSEVPVVMNSVRAIEHPIPRDIADEIGIEEGEPVRYEPVAVDGGLGLGVDITAGPDVTGERSNETRPRKSSTSHHFVAYYPKVLAHMMGLHETAHDVSEESGAPDDGIAGLEDSVFAVASEGGDEEAADEMGCTATFEVVSDYTVRVRFSDQPEPWVAPASDLDDAAAELKPTRATINPVGYTEKQRKEFDKDESAVAKYRLFIPDAFADAYDLKAAARASEEGKSVSVDADDDPGQTRVAFRYGVHAGHVVLRMDMDPDPDLSDLVYANVISQESGRPDDGAVVEQFTVHPPKTGLHSVNIAIDRDYKDNRTVWLEPEGRSVMLRPIDTEVPPPEGA
jgi:hypothetical protein